MRGPGRSAARRFSIAILLAGVAVARLARAAPETWQKLFDVFHTRIDAAAAYDPVGQRMIVFGGHFLHGSANPGRTLNDLWSLNLQGTPHWTRLSPTTSPPRRYGSSLIYQPNQARFVLFGGRDDNGTVMDDVWELKLAGVPTWAEIFPATSGGSGPAARAYHGAVYEAAGDRMIVTAGVDGSPSGYCLGDTWELTLGASPTWTALAPTGAAPTGAVAAGLDPVSGSVFAVPNLSTGAGCSPNGGTFRLTLGVSPAWTRLTGIGAPANGGVGSAMIYDATGARFLMVGSYDPGLDLMTSSVSQLAPSGGSWTAVNPAGAIPPGRTGISLVFDPVAVRAIAFAGRSREPQDDRGWNDTWSLSLAGGMSWSKITPLETPPAERWDPVAIWDSQRGRMVLFGGSLGDIFWWNDAWTLDPDGPAWSAIVPTGTAPAGRAAPSAIYDSSRDRMVIFGGQDASGDLADVWALSFGGTPAWSAITPTGTGPSARHGAAAIYDPGADRMLVFGGLDGGGAAEVWQLKFTGSPAWSAISTTGTPPTASGGWQALYDDAGGRALVYSGPLDALALDGTDAWSSVSPGSGTVPYEHPVFDPIGRRVLVERPLWVPSTTTEVSELPIVGPPGASLLSPLGTPPPGHRLTAIAFDPVNRRLILHGGIARHPEFQLGFASNTDNDLWMLQVPPCEPPVLVSGPPAKVHATPGSTTQLTITVSGSRVTTFQWYRDTGSQLIALEDGASISGATTATLTIANADECQTSVYRCVFANGCGTDQTGAIALQVSQSIYGIPATNTTVVYPGSNPNQIEHPVDIAVSRNGRLFVLDAGHHRVARFALDGAFQTAWGSAGSGPGQFSAGVSGLAADEFDHVYVADPALHRVQRFSQDGAFQIAWGTPGSGAGEFSGPNRIAVDRQGNVYVGDVGNGRVQKFDADGQYLAQWPSSGRRGLSVAPDGRVYHAGDVVHRFDASGAASGTIGTPGCSEGQMQDPAGIVIDRCGDLYVVDAGNDRIQKFAATGEPLMRWGMAGVGDDQFMGPLAVAVDTMGGVLVADSARSDVRWFGPGLSAACMGVGIGDLPTVALAPRITVSPNPSRSETVMEFTGLEARTAVAWVHDIHGRRVASLCAATITGTQARFVWNGCSDRGVRCASGLYFVTVRAGENETVVKVARTR